MSAQVQVVMTGDEATLFRSLQKIINQQDKMGEGFRKVQGAGDFAAKKLTSGFESANASMLRWVGTLGSAATAVGALTKAIGDLRDIEDQAGKSLEASAPGKRLFLQLASTEGELAALNKHADDLRARGMVTAAAQDVVFKARSAGMNLDEVMPLLGDLTEIGFQPQTAIEAALKFQGAFGGAGRGAAGAGSFRDIVNKLLAGAATSPVSASEMARVGSIVSSTFASIGGQDEELVAALSQMSNITKTPETAAERLKAVSAQVAIKRNLLPASLRDKSALDVIAALPALAESGDLFLEEDRPRRRGERRAKREPVSLEKFLGSVEAVEGARLIATHREAIAGIEANIRAAESGTGTGGDLLGGRLALGRRQPDLVATKRKEVTERLLELERERSFGVLETAADAMQAARARALERYWGTGLGGRMASWGVQQADRLSRAVSGPRGFLEGAIREERGNLRAHVEADELDAAVEALRTAGESLTDGATRLPRSPTLSPRSEK